MKVRLFLEVNPRFIGEINVTVIRLNEDDYATADNKELEKLKLKAKCLEALKREKIQKSARRRILDHYIRVKEVNFHITDKHAYAHIVVAAITK